jgi:peptide/nickel transport system substrate-binding protein
VFQELMTTLSITTVPETRTALNQRAQRMIAEDYVNGYLFQLAKTGVADAGIEGLWENSPTQANDLTGVRWTQ